MSVCPSVCLSVRMEQLGSHWTHFSGILYLKVFRKSVDQNSSFIKTDKNYGYFTWRPIYIYDNISLNSF